MHYFNNNFLIHDSKLKMIFFFAYRGSSTCTVSNSTISTSTIFQKVLHKIVLVGDLLSKFVLAELIVCKYYSISMNFA